MYSRLFHREVLFLLFTLHSSRLEEGPNLIDRGLPPFLSVLLAERLPELSNLLLNELGDHWRPLDESGELIHIFVEEREDRDRAIDPLVQVLIHEVRVLIAQEDPHLDVGKSIHELRHHRNILERIPAPVFREYQDFERFPKPPPRLAILGADLDFLKKLEEALFVRRHLVQILLKRHPLLKPLLRHH